MNRINLKLTICWVLPITMQYKQTFLLCNIFWKFGKRVFVSYKREVCILYILSIDHMATKRFKSISLIGPISMCTSKCLNTKLHHLFHYTLFVPSARTVILQKKHTKNSTKWVLDYFYGWPLFLIHLPYCQCLTLLAEDSPCVFLCWCSPLWC